MDRLPATRTKARVRTSSRSPLRVEIGTRRVCRATLGSSSAGSRSVLRAPVSRSPIELSAPRSAISTRSGAVAKLVSPSSEAKTAPPMRAAPHSPVRIVPVNHCTEMRRRSTRPPGPPSTDSGGSLPRSTVSAKTLRPAPRSLVWSKTSSPCTAPWRGMHPLANNRNPTVAAPKAGAASTAPRSARHVLSVALASATGSSRHPDRVETPLRHDALVRSRPSTRSVATLFVLSNSAAVPTCGGAGHHIAKNG